MPVEVYQIGITVIIFGALGDVLMHSHVWLSWGRFNHIFFCPAMHQIHHSRALKHLYRNFGAALSVWDLIFGTIYLPNRREDITYGIYEENKQLYTNALVAWVRPFYEIMIMHNGIVDVIGKVFGRRVRELLNRPDLVRSHPSSSPETEKAPADPSS
jgi:hypothetical protein